MSIGDRYSADTFEHAIADAVKDGKLSVAVSLLKLMAVTHPHRAEALLNVVEPALEALKQGRGGQDANPTPTAGTTTPGGVADE